MGEVGCGRERRGTSKLGARARSPGRFAGRRGDGCGVGGAGGADRGGGGGDRAAGAGGAVGVGGVARGGRCAAGDVAAVGRKEERASTAISRKRGARGRRAEAVNWARGPVALDAAPLPCASRRGESEVPRSENWDCVILKIMENRAGMCLKWGQALSSLGGVL